MAATATIQLTAGQATALVMFRDGVDGAWQPATKKSATSYEIAAHGPYFVMVACDFDGVASTEQIGRTLDDPHDLGTFCDKPLRDHRVSGQMVQAGQMVFGKHFELSTAPSWQFQFFVADGDYDLVAATSDRIAVRRAVAVAGADLAITTPVDVAVEGTALADAAFSAANAAAGEDLRASVLVGTASSAQVPLYVGPAATAKVTPESVLQATDSQTVSVQALSMPAPGSTVGRALRRPFRVGGNAGYTLPSPIAAVHWTLDSGRPAVSWTSRPEPDNLFAFTEGNSTDALHFTSNGVSLSVPFLTATGLTQMTIDTDIAGLKPEWKVDLAHAYSRELDFQRVDSGVISTIWQTDSVNATPAAIRAASPTSHAPSGAIAAPR